MKNTYQTLLDTLKSIPGMSKQKSKKVKIVKR